MVSRFITEDNKLIIHFKSKDTEGLQPYNDYHIPIICRGYLDNLVVGKDDYVGTGQELVMYMFRALLFKEYKHIQEQVTFLIDGTKVVYDHNMRNASGIYPPSVYEDCCDVLLGCV